MLQLDTMKKNISFIDIWHGHSFDKPFNHISKQKKLNVCDFYFNEMKQELARSYIELHFMGHGTAEEIFD